MRRQAAESMVKYLFLLAALAAAPELEAQAEGKTSRAILFGWDGAQRAHVQEAMAAGRLPVLASLAASGSWSDIDIKGVTDTKAGWAEILTGYGPDLTGVYSNAKYRPIPAGYTIFESLERFFGSGKFATVATIGKKSHVGGYAAPVRISVEELRALGKKGSSRELKNSGYTAKQVDELLKAYRGVKKDSAGNKADQEYSGASVVVEAGKEYLVIPGEPYYFTHTRADAWENGLILNRKVEERALAYLEKYKDSDFFFFVHFAEIDSMGHKYGENSREYDDALADCDARTGNILAKLKELGLEGKVGAFVTADHGFDEGQTHHKSAPAVFLASSVKGLAPSGSRSDIAPTIYWSLGVSASAFDPPLYGKPLVRR